MKYAACLSMIVFAFVACGDDDRPGGTRDTGPGFDSAVDGDLPDIPGTDSGAFDPFDPDNACGLSTIETERIPGSLLIVFDRSGSMDNEVGGSTRWNLAVAGMNSVLSSVSDELNAGLMLFSAGGDCDVSSTPDVAIAPLSTSRSQIQSVLASNSPGGSTPSYAALEAGYDYLDTLDTPGQRGLVLVSDGGESCEFERRSEVMARVQNENLAKGRLTFAVGLDFANNDLSTIAFNGGTPRVPGCLAECTSGSCLNESDCSGAPCVQILEGEPGFCSCENDGQCVMPQTCNPPPIMIPCLGLPPAFCEAANANRCTGDANCCQYNAAASDFQAQFEDALDEIARRLLDSCVFDVPAGTEGFNPGQVNVGVTFEGEERQVLRRGDDPSVDSWSYADPSNTSLVIQGPICDRLLMGGATVEIVLGCDTILI